MILQVDIPNIKQIEKRLGTLRSKAPDVMRRAINSAIRHTASEISKEAKKSYIVGAPAVKKTLNIHRAKKSNLSGMVVSRSNRKIPLYGFRVNPPVIEPRNPPSFYESQVRKKAGLKRMTGSNDRSKAFVTKMSSGHVGIFQRQLGKRRKNGLGEPIAELFGPAVPTVIRSLEVSKPIRDDATKYLRAQVDREIHRLLGGGKG